MQSIHRVLTLAAWRIALSRYVQALPWALSAGVLAIIAARVAERGGVIEPAWMTLLAWVGGVALVVPAVWAGVRWPGRLAVARRVDEGADLRESISTALCVADRSDSWSKLVVSWAEKSARGVRLAAAIPIAAPRTWPTPIAMLAVLLVVWMAVPAFDPTGQRAQAAEQDREVRQAEIEAKQAVEAVEDLASRAGLEEHLAQLEAQEIETPRPSDPQEIRQAAIKRLTSLEDLLKSRMEGEKGQQLDALRQELRKMRVPGDGPLTEMAKKLQRGDFHGSAEELQKAIEQLAQSQLTPEQQQQMAAQLEQMAEQLKQLAESQNQLEQQLQEAGLDPSLAANPRALEQALQQAQNLTDEQRQQLMQQAQAAQQASQAMQQLSQAMDGLCQACQNPGQGQGEQLAQAAGNMMNQLSQLEMMNAEMAAAQAALSELQAQMAGLCQGAGAGSQGMGAFAGGGSMTSGAWREGISQGNMGMGQGGPGQGMGGSMGEEKAEENWQTRKANAPLGDGPIIATRFVEGDAIQGESKAGFVAAVTQAEQGFAEAIETGVIPREFHEPIKRYYSGLMGRAGEGQPAPPPPAQPAGDAER